MVNISKDIVNVYVFGAGASVHVGGPLTKDFIQEGIHELCMSDLYKVSEDSFYNVIKLIDMIYGTELLNEVEQAKKENMITISSSLENLSNINIEELLTFMELGAISDDRWLNYEGCLDDLYKFIFETIDVLSKGHRGRKYSTKADGTYDYNRNYYDKLIDYVVKPAESNCFISFNYDLFLDRAVSINNHNLLGDYNLPFCIENISNFPGYERIVNGERNNYDVDILKPHGSLNWARCSNCNDLYLTYHQEYKSILSRKCKKCGNTLSPILIAPTLRKNIIQSGLKNIWHKAEEFLINADNIVIIGYSFPDADIEAKWLFKRSLARNNKRPTLTIAEPNEKVAEKIKAIVGSFVGEIHYFKSFEDYIDKVTE